MVGTYAHSAAAREVSSLPLGSLETLLSRISSGDESALNTLYDATSGRVFGLVLRILHDRTAAEDILLEVFGQVWLQADRFDPSRGTAITWILTLARSRAIDLLRSRASRAGKEVELDAAAPFVDGSLDPEESVLLNQRVEAVGRALETLSEGQREAITAAFFEGLTHTEIAEALGVPLGTIKTRIRSGLTALRAALAREQESFS